MKINTILSSLPLISLLLGVYAPNAYSETDSCVRITAHASSGEKLSMDPAVSTSSEDLLYTAAIYDPLVHLDSNFNPTPGLAKSWESNADATEWTFHLRKGVKFHDGSDFDSSDVVFTFKRLIDPDTASGAAAVLSFLDTDGIEAIDKYTVRFTTKDPTVQLPMLLRNKFTLIVPEGATREGMDKLGVGTGPFIQETFTKGAPFNILVRNTEYWDDGLPKADCIKTLVISDPITQSAALKAGNTDVVLVLSPVAASSLKGDPGVNIVTANGGVAMTLSMWIDTPPFDDIRVRQAMKLVVDRQAIVDGPLLGLGEVGNDNPVPISHPAAFSKTALKRDVNKAKQLLASAGYPDGLSVDLYTSTVPPGAIDIAQAYVSMAAEAGIKVNLIKAPAATFWSETWLKKPFLTSGWSARPPATALAVTYRKNSKWHETHWARDDYDALLDQANSTPDTESRIKLFQQAQKMLAEEGGVIIPAFSYLLSGIRVGCTGYNPHPSNQYVDLRSIECKH